MRTTFNAVNRHTQYVIGDKYADLSKLQKKIATGKELSDPSDDPIAVSNVLGLRSNNIGLKQFEKNINDGLSWMQITDTTMVSMNTILQRGRELAIQGDSDTLSAKERLYLAQECQQLTRQLVSLANSKFKGDYIFSGSQTDKPPVPMGISEAKDPTSYASFTMSYFDGTSGNPIQIKSPRGSLSLAPEDVTRIIPGSFSLSVMDMANPGTMINLKEGLDYSVDYAKGQITVLPTANSANLNQNFDPTGLNYSNLKMNFDYASNSRDVYDREINTDSAIYREIESGVRVQINTSVNDFTVNGNTNMINSMIKLGESLIHNDQKGIRASIDLIDTSFSKILSAQSENGARVNLFNNTLDRNDNQQVETTRIQAEMEDADFAESVSQYNISQTVFNAALQSTAKIMQSSLASYI